MPLYSVWIGYHGYDVNALVKAKDGRAAKTALLKALAFDSNTTLINEKNARDYFGDKEELDLVHEMLKAKNGSVKIYSEGT